MKKVEFENFLKQVNEDIQQAFESSDYEKAICCSKFLCSLYYEYDYKYYDDQLENIAIKVAEKFVGETLIKKTNTKKVFFYDRFALADRGLANIYVDALLNLGYEVIWCMLENGSQVKKIMERFQSRKNIHFELIPNLSIINRMVFLQNLICESKAYHYFIYTLPWDVEGIGVFSTLCCDVKRYLINLTDHTFWIGAKSLDYSIEFRNLGANISTEYRKIAPEKIAILPFYPDERECESYQGMPFPEGEEFVFSGGSAYKIEGSTKYEEIVSHILDSYPKLNFVFATNDQSEKLDKLKEKYENRFFIIKERSDLNSILERAKFYLATYPLGGGLMTQYALMNNCLPFCLIDRGNDFINPSSWLLHPEKIDFIFYDKEELFKKVDEIMRQDFRFVQYKDCVISKKRFSENLLRIMNGKQTEYIYNKEKIDVRLFHESYEIRLYQQSLQNIIRNTSNMWIKKKYDNLNQEL